MPVSGTVFVEGEVLAITTIAADDSAQGAAVEDEAPWPSPVFAWGWTVVLVLALASSYVDRQILSLMVDPIRRDIHITDTQFSLLSGLAFTLFYSIMGLPLGALIDRAPRRIIVSFGLIVWSAATAICGLSRTFTHLLAARVAVSMGEASLGPSASSLLADCFPPAKLGRALSVYMIGAAIGSGLALMLGGGIITYVENSAPLVVPGYGALRPWQTVFVLVGILGLPLTLLMLLLPEPARRGRSKAAAGAPSWADVFAFLRSRSDFIVPLLCSAACYSTMTMANLSWSPAYFMRVFGLSAGYVGLYLGIATVIGITTGVMIGATISERLIARGRADGHLVTSAMGVAFCAIMMTVAMSIADHRLALPVLCIALIGSNVPSGITVACLQTVTPNRLRGRMSAILFVVLNVFGATLGPLLPALLTDYLFHDGTLIGRALAIVSAVVGTLGTLSFLRAARGYRQVIADGRGAIT